MGFTGLARWLNAPPNGLDIVQANLRANHSAAFHSRWHLSIKSYRSVLTQTPDSTVQSERNMFALTMDDNVFIHLEDPAAPTRADVLAVAPPGQEAMYLKSPSHYRNTFLAMRPPGGLEQLLAQIKARWISVRQAAGQRNNITGQQLIIEGRTYSIGTDWMVRVGNVQLAGGAIKGMLLEAEYLPLPLLRSAATDNTSELLSNLLTSILPNIPDAKTVAVTFNDAHWQDQLWDREKELSEMNDPVAVVDNDDPYAWDNTDIAEWKQGDWAGVDREQRSAYLIIGALRSEGLL
uniref:Mediator of RNA polymerase II transcription subunit 20 n=1 Tax=Psilocybe cubensis TaxID=181762 RepID=A0A8H7XYP6_PSICU